MRYLLLIEADSSCHRGLLELNRRVGTLLHVLVPNYRVLAKVLIRSPREDPCDISVGFTFWSLITSTVTHWINNLVNRGVKLLPSPPGAMLNSPGCMQ